MSFILDALRKSESERQKRSSPSMFEVRVAPPRSRLPLWALALGGLLGINLLILLFVLLRGDGGPAAAPPTAASGVSAVAGTPAPPAMQPSTPISIVVNPAPAAPAPAAAAPSGDPRFDPPLIEEPLPASEPVGGGAFNANDFVPALPPQPAAAAGSPSRRPAVGGPDGLSTREQLLAAGRSIPEANMGLHAYDADPSRRFVMLNGQRVREGESQPSGLAVERITSDGAVLVFQGNRFFVPIP